MNIVESVIGSFVRFFGIDEVWEGFKEIAQSTTLFANNFFCRAKHSLLGEQTILRRDIDTWTDWEARIRAREVLYSKHCTMDEKKGLIKWMREGDANEKRVEAVDVLLYAWSRTNSVSELNFNDLNLQELPEGFGAILAKFPNLTMDKVDVSHNNAWSPSALAIIKELGLSNDDNISDDVDPDISLNMRTRPSPYYLR